MGVHKTWLKPDGTLATGAFQNRGGAMSTDWSKYATPEETRQRRRTPADNAVVSMNVGKVRAVPGQSVTHTPLPENRAHTDVLGEKDEEARVLLRRASTIVLGLLS